MHWLWVDRVIELVPGERVVAIKNICYAEEQLWDHFAAGVGGRLALPIMPASLIIEGMAQAAGILVGAVNDFQEKVILAKIGRAEFWADVGPGATLRYSASIERIDSAGAATSGIVEAFDHATGMTDEIGRIDLVFSHVDQNMGGLMFPPENFVFTDGFRTLLRTSGIEVTF